MGTNYYLITKSKRLVHTHFATKVDYGGAHPEYLDQEYKLCDVPDFYYEIHLNKCSMGWRPLFQRHKAFQSFTELENFVKKYQRYLTIQNEYGETFTLDEYKKIIVDHGSRKPEPMKWVYKEDKICGVPGKLYLQTERCKESEADLYMPFIHSEYGHTKMEAYQRLRSFGQAGYIYVGDCLELSKYSEDPDYPIDWCDGEFS